MNFRIFFAFQGVLLHSFVTKPVGLKTNRGLGWGLGKKCPQKDSPNNPKWWQFRKIRLNKHEIKHDIKHDSAMAPFIDGHIAGTTGFQPQRQLKIICPDVHRTHQFATESKALSVGVHRHVPDMRMRTAAMPDGLIFFDSKLKIKSKS